MRWGRRELLVTSLASLLASGMAPSGALATGRRAAPEEPAAGAGEAPGAATEAPGGDLEDAPAEAPGDASAPPLGELPVPEEPPPPLFEPPPLPAPDADFSQDRGLFREVETGPERDREAELAAEKAAVVAEAPLYRRQPALDWTTRSVAGVFGAGVVGLLGGSIGNAINAGDDRQPLGGFHGPAIGASVGSIAGVGLAVWGAGQLFERPGAPYWPLLGATAGALVGGAAATGIASGLERGDTASALAVGTFVAFQVGGALLFDAVFGD